MATIRHPQNALPRYLQISEFLIREITAGRLTVGQRLAPEREMAVELGVSVGTLRKALRELEEKGLLERIQGSGNYIRRNDAAESVYAMFRLELIGGGGLPRADLLHVEEMEKPSDLPEFGVSARGARIRRLRYLNDAIVALEEIWLDRGAGVIDPDTLSDSLYRHYSRHLGLRIVRAEDYVAIAEVPEWAPGAFPLSPGAPAGFVERLSWADKPAPIEYSRTWFDARSARYVQRLE
ncbi:MAG: GntR family transcriptional regulator [Pseudomonadota bacterium]